jgi:UDP-N-acetylmuramoyl-L-alanyl-D-glutamate--2,6-diaminopimelate ligase
LSLVKERELESKSGEIVSDRAKRAMDLGDVLEGIEGLQVKGPADELIQAVACDSRKVQPGALFFALPGTKADGNTFVADAVAHGAVAIASATARPHNLEPKVTWIQIPAGKERRALARAAANFFDHPAETLKLVGITGTNGKTTTSFLVDSILRAAGLTTLLVGTTGYFTPQGKRKASNTTPESLDLHEMFAGLRDAGGTHAVLEVSSHSLVMERVCGCHFAVAVFTNLTRDHLNFHKTFEDYFAAKRKLFEGTGAGAGAPDVAVINADDPYSPRLEGLARKTLTYGLKSSADLTTKNFTLSFEGLDFTAETPAGKMQVHSTLVGRINVYNILAAIGAAIALEIPNPKIEEGIAKLEVVPGRFEIIDEGQPFHVVVDYAHADDAMRNLIMTARELVPSGRIITVFGAGGERDRSTRPLMGEAAGSQSDLVILTSDNPRSEDPLRIINDVIVGLQKVVANYRIEPDRDAALEMALTEAKRGDIVLLAGKGHENYQILRDRTFEFDDREKARAILRRKGFSRKAAGS